MKYLSFVISILIIVAVLIPGRDLPDVNIGGYDKLIHICMFASWALALCYDFGTSRHTRYRIFIAGVLFSLFTEALQILVEGRTFDLYDMAADTIGLVFGLLLAGPLINRIRRGR